MKFKKVVEIITVIKGYTRSKNIKCDIKNKMWGVKQNEYLSNSLFLKHNEPFPFLGIKI